jgi:hypothetical protein
MLYNNDTIDVEFKNSLTIQEEAYINSQEYRNITQQTKWIVITVALAEIAGILLWLYV